MAKKNDFYEKPPPDLIDRGDEGMLLQFSANGRNISDFLLEPSDIKAMLKEMTTWLIHHPIDSDLLSDDEVKQHIERTLQSLRFGIGSSRASRILRELSAKWDD